MNEQVGGRPARLALARRVAALAAALAGTALLATACGGSPAAGSDASSGQSVSQQLDSFASCMRSHGEPSFYFSHLASGPSAPAPEQPEVIIDGSAAPANPTSPQFQSAQKACQHLLPMSISPTAAELHQQFIRALKGAACMRAHGYPNWPDPTVRNGQLTLDVPDDIDTNSLQLQSAVKACGGAVVMPPGGL